MYWQPRVDKVEVGQAPLAPGHLILVLAVIGWLCPGLLLQQICLLLIFHQEAPAAAMEALGIIMVREELAGERQDIQATVVMGPIVTPIS